VQPQRHEPAFNGALGDAYELFGTGRDALYSLIAQLEPLRVKVPMYGCNSLALAAKSAGVGFDYYPISEALLAEGEGSDAWCPGDVVVVPHYFGVVNTDFLQSLRGLGLIVVSDVTHCLFDTAVTREIAEQSDYIFASFRKSFATPDGGFLGSVRHQLPGPSDRVRMGFVAYRTAGLVSRGFAAVGGLVSEANRPYFAIAEDELEKFNPGDYAISDVGKECLHSFDFDTETNAIATNTRALLSNLPPRSYSPSPLSSLSPLVLVIFDTAGEMEGVRGQLIKKRVYLPQHWPGIARRAPDHFSRRSLSVPVDARYTEDIIRSIFETESLIGL
jgi:hypothetical protein